MTAYRLTPSAKGQLIEIWRYSAARWGDARADHYLRMIEARLNDAASGKKVLRNRPDIGDGLHSMVCGSHVVFMRRGARLIVVGVLHQSMDPARHLASEEEERGDGAD